MTSVVSLGGNVGDRLAYLRGAVELLAPETVSPVWETAPVGGVEQPDFLNVVALCPWDAAETWRRACVAEALAGRDRSGPRWGPRTLDVDVVVADGSDSGLVLPHPRAAVRAFVLLPWLDVDPDAELPGAGRVADLLADLDLSTCRRFAGTLEP